MVDINHQVFELLTRQNEQTHALLTGLREDLKEHYKEDGVAWKKLERIETTLSNTAWTAGIVIGIGGLIVTIIQLFK